MSPAEDLEGDRRIAQEYAERFPDQSDAEPVAWRYKPTPTAQEWAVTMQREPECKSWGWVVEPLYTAPPRPGTSVWLTEAADISEQAWQSLSPRPNASEIEQLKAELRNTWQRLETTLASEEGWKKRCQLVEAERDEARASRSPDASAGLIEAAEIAEKSAEYHRKRCDLADTVKMQLISSSKSMAAGEIAKELRARAADRSGKHAREEN